MATYTLGTPVSTIERADAVRDLEHTARRTRWATVLESGFVAGTRQAAAGAPSRSRWATVLASGFVDAPLRSANAVPLRVGK